MGFMIPCFMPCMMKNFMKQANRNFMQQAKAIQDIWSGLVRTQADIYRPLGVNVSLAQELISSGDHLRTAPVGLRFEIVHQADATTPSTQQDIVSRLKDLHELYKSGAISSAEYKRVKASIINDV